MVMGRAMILLTKRAIHVSFISNAHKGVHGLASEHDNGDLDKTRSFFNLASQNTGRQVRQYRTSDEHQHEEVPVCVPQEL